MEHDPIHDLVNQVRQEIINKSNNPNKDDEGSSISTQCQICNDGLVIDGFCMNCGGDSEDGS